MPPKPASATEGAPTMIIPNGTRIEVDGHNQLSIRTPGNLVLQNSGSYGTIESATGSIRIEPNVQVEAVTVECADVCYIQGSLTAWKVKARSIELEESARAHIILQETESLHIGREARMVGNFRSEKELFLLLSRFAKQLRGMPFYNEKRMSVPQDMIAGAEAVLDITSTGSSPAAAPEHDPYAGRYGHPEAAPIAANLAEDAAPPAPAPGGDELPEGLLFALVLLEREGERPGNGPRADQAVSQLLKLLRSRDLETLGDTYHELFRSIVEPSDDISRAREMVHGHFSTAPQPAS